MEIKPQEDLDFNKTEFEEMTKNIDPSSDKYPYCIVWSPLPVITWFLPFIGHTGIGNSEGVLVS